MLKLDTILSIVLISFFILSYGLAPRHTPYWLFAAIFISFLGLIFLDLSSLKDKIFQRSKGIILAGLILVVLLAAFGSEITLRHQSLPTFRVHDILIQQEYAIQFLLSGKNPYATNYFGTPLEQWYYSGSEKNPALYHFVMEPFYVIFSIPFYVASGHLFGFFDGRITLLFLIFLILFFIQKLNLDGERKRAFMALLLFNPLTLPYALEGRSDYFMFAFLFGALLFLHNQRLFLASFFLGLSFAVKQSAWPLFPLWITYIWFKYKDKNKVIKASLLFLTTFLLFVLPFLWWDPKAFVDSTVFYLSGNTVHSYPISGYGFGMMLNQFGIIKNIHDKFPFILFQFAFSIPVLYLLVKSLKKDLQVRTLIIYYSILLFIFWYFSRYFNNSHIAYITTLITSAYFWPEQKNKVK